MVPAILLTAALSLGQVTAYDGPIRQWKQAVINGQTQWVWGWEPAPGWVQYHQHEQPAARRPAAPTPPAYSQPLSPGQTIDANGTLNNGLMLNATVPTVGLQTNDPDLGRKLELGQRRCKPDPPDEPDPPDDPDAPPEPSARELVDKYAVPMICVVCAAGLFIAAARARRPASF